MNYQHRLQLLAEIIRLLLTMVPQQRGRILREQDAIYSANSETDVPDVYSDDETLRSLLQDVPLPDP